MAVERGRFRMDHPVIITFLILAIIAFMYFAAEVLKPLALAILLSLALLPISRFLERRKVPRGVAVPMTLVGALALLGGIGYVVGQQLNELARELPEARPNIEKKLTIFQPKPDSAVSNISRLAEDVSKKLDAPVPKAVEAVAAKATVVENMRQGPGAEAEGASGPLAQAEGAQATPSGATLSEPVKVEVVARPSFQERLEGAIGPYLEPVTVGLFVLVLSMFMMMSREDLADRLLALFGDRQVSQTTRTMGEVGTRISRYLGTFAAVNSGYGLVVGIGLAIIGVPFAVLWGFLAAVLRFIPYVGPAIAIVLPTVFTVAYAPDWTQPIIVLVFFAVMELVATYGLEPIVYGRTTGVSALGLLIAAMFWTWLWGAMGLLLSTPLTVCLAVLGKYVPSLRAFATLLGEEAELEPDVRLYQRLVGLDQDGAAEVVEEALKKHPRAEVFDTIVVPALGRAERDAARDELDERGLAFVWRFADDLLDEIEGTPEGDLLALAGAGAADGKGSRPIRVVGVPANDRADELALRMLRTLIGPVEGVELEIVDGAGGPMRVADAIGERKPDVVLVSHVPPGGLTNMRYMVRRLKAALGDVPVWAGRWGEQGDTAALAEQLRAAGAARSVFSLAEARERLAEAGRPKVPPLAPAPRPATAKA